MKQGLPSDLSLVWFVDRTTGRLARVRLPLEKGTGESPSDMASKESADASDRCSVWSPKLGCGLCDGFGLLVCKTEYSIICLLEPEYSCVWGGGEGERKNRSKKSKLLQILVHWRSLLCKKTVSSGILLRILLLYIHIANFIANKALRARHAEEMYSNAIPWCSNNYCTIGMSTHTYWTFKIRKVFIVLS